MAKNDDNSAALASLAGSMLSAATSVVGSKKEYQYTKRLMNYQNDINLSNWAKQNEYNLPKNQMQRFADAGLNPNLIYGQQNTSGGIGGVTPHDVDTGIREAGLSIGNALANIPSLLADLSLKHQNLELGKAQTDNVQAQAEKTRSETLSKELNETSKKLDNDLKQANIDGVLSDTQYKKMRNETFYEDFTSNMLLRRYQMNSLVAGITKTNQDRLNSIYNLKLAKDNLELSKSRFNFEKQKYKSDSDFRNKQFQYQKNVDKIKNAPAQWDYDNLYSHGLGTYRTPALQDFQTLYMSGNHAFRQFIDELGQKFKKLIQ